MLLSHCGEYPCECKNKYSRQIRQKVANIRRMGLRMQFATNRNDRKMIAIHSQVFVSIRGRSRQIRQKIYDCPGELYWKARPYKWLRMLANFLRIPANFLRSLRLLNNQCGEFLVNPLRMLRILLVQGINSNLCDISMVRKQQCQCCNLPRSIDHGWTRNIYRRRAGVGFYTILVTLATSTGENVQYSHWNRQDLSKNLQDNLNICM